MYGLMIKDLCLMKQQKNSMLIMLAVAIFLAFSGNDSSFVVSYLSLLATTLAIGTITYDDFGNGMSFLFTLPTSRISYINEKYVFGSLFTLSVWVLSSVLTSVINVITHKTVALTDHWLVCGVILGVVLLTMSLMMPVHLKYGSEKSRVVMIIVMGVIAVVVFLGSKLVDLLGISKEQAVNFIDHMNSYAFIAIAILSILVILLLSYRISIKIIMKKEF